MAARRRLVKDWNALSAAQKKRYIGAAGTGTLTGTPIKGTKAEVTKAARTYYCLLYTSDAADE